MNVDSLPSKWDDIVEVLNQVRWNNSIWSVVKRLCVGALVYYIWQERNARHFKNETRSGECVQGCLDMGFSWIMGDIEMVGPQIYRMMPLIDANPRSFCKVVAAEWLKIAFMKEM
ncbi:hypothetical protein Tco_0899223 [Tanacetum coccineum]